MLSAEPCMVPSRIATSSTVTAAPQPSTYPWPVVLGGPWDVRAEGRAVFAAGAEPGDAPGVSWCREGGVWRFAARSRRGSCPYELEPDEDLLGTSAFRAREIVIDRYEIRAASEPSQTGEGAVGVGSVRFEAGVPVRVRVGQAHDREEAEADFLGVYGEWFRLGPWVRVDGGFEAVVTLGGTR